MLRVASGADTPRLAVEFRSERDVVVEFAAGLTSRDWLALGRTARARLAARIRACTSGGATIACATPKHLHLVRVDLGRVAIAAFLVLPLARAQLALDIDL